MPGPPEHGQVAHPHPRQGEKGTARWERKNFQKPARPTGANQKLLGSRTRAWPALRQEDWEVPLSAHCLSSLQRCS